MPAKLHSWYAQTSSICWRCGEDTGTLVDIWWHCPHLAPFWHQVRDLIKLITETKIVLHAACCLLNISTKRYKNLLTKHLLNAAKVLIPTRWRTTRVPSIVDWLARVSEICEMEDTLAQASDRVDRFHKNWSPWFEFRYFETYIDLQSGWKCISPHT